MLQNTVAGIPELHQVKVQSSHDIAHGKSPLTFASYKTLLLSAASTYDSKWGLCQRKSTCCFYSSEHTTHTFTNHNLSLPSCHDNNSHDVTPTATDISFDIDTDYSCLHINQSVRQPQTFQQSGRQPHTFWPSMSKEKWHSLSKTEQELWDKFSPQSKATILGILNPNVTCLHPNKISTCMTLLLLSIFSLYTQVHLLTLTLLLLIINWWCFT